MVYVTCFKNLLKLLKIMNQIKYLKNFLYFLIIISVCLITYQNCFCLNYILDLKLPSSVENCNATCIYKGSKINFDNNSCILKEKNASPSFFLIITPEISFSCNGNIFCMKRVKNVDCKAYFLTLKEKNKTEMENDNSELYKWDILTLDPDKIPNKLPEHIIVLQLPADYVTTLENPSKIIRSNSRNLPKIVLRSTLTQEEIDDALTDIALTTPDINSLCTNHTIFRKGAKIVQQKDISADSN